MAGFGGVLLGGIAQGVEAGQKQDLAKAELGIRNRLADIQQQEADTNAGKVKNDFHKSLLDMASKATTDASALYAEIIKASPDKSSPSLLAAAQHFRNQIGLTYAPLVEAKVPGAMAAYHAVTEKFDAITAGLPSAVEAATTKGQASGAEAVAAAPGQASADIFKTKALAPVQAAAEGMKAGAVTTAQGQATNALAPATAAAQGNALATKAATLLGRPLTDPEKLQLSGAGVDQFGPLEMQGGVLGQTDKRTGKFNVVMKPETPESITTNPSGGFTFTRGGAGDKALQTDAAKKLPELTDQLVALQNVRSIFKPEFLTFAGQGAASMTAMMEKLSLDPSPEAKKQLADITTFQSKAINQLNTAIKAMSGSAVSTQEEGRMLADMPSPKTDSPTQFMAKLDSKIQDIKMATARYAYAAKNGMSDPTVIPLDRMPAIMADRAKAIKAQSPGITDANLGQQLSREFGLIGQ